MAYGDRDEVSQILRLGDTLPTRFETAVDKYLVKASGYIDNMVGQYTTVPLSSVPAVVDDIANDWTAGMWSEDHPVEEGVQHTDARSRRAKSSIAVGRAVVCLEGEVVTAVKMGIKRVGDIGSRTGQRAV